MNFVMDGEHPFGQGVTTYENGKIVNWITTLADAPRVGHDMGQLRFLLQMFHKPLYGWKGNCISSSLFWVCLTDSSNFSSRLLHGH